MWELGMTLMLGVSSTACRKGAVNMEASEDKSMDSNDESSEDAICASIQEYVGEGTRMASETASRTTSSGLSCYDSVTTVQRNAAADTMSRSVIGVKHDVQGKSRSKSRNIVTGSLKKHYAPCGCKSECADDCRCVAKNMSCEKYCGCPRQCKNRYRGCYCLAGQCRSKDCCCFVAERECDPDICRNCCASGKDGPAGKPPVNKIICNNMNILIGRSKQIYKGLSDVAGNGAFTLEAIKKDEYVGEYTGEAILHEEADERQEDHPDSSYLFELDEKYVIDGRYEGSSLRYVNHLSKPNCYSKNVFYEGAQRIGYFAKRNIESGEELFINYGRKYVSLWKNIEKVEHLSNGAS